MTIDARLYKRKGMGTALDMKILDFPCSEEPLKGLSVEDVEEATKSHPRRLLHLQSQSVLFRSREWIDIPAGLDFRVWGVEGSAPAPTELHRSSARVFLPLSGEALQSMHRLDECLRLANQQKSDRTSPAPSWVPMVKKSERLYTPGVSVKVNLTGKSYTGTRPTQFKVLMPNHEVETGMGWSFLEPRAQISDDFKKGSCLVLLEPVFWEMDGKSGVTLNALALWLRPSKSIMHDESLCSVQTLSNIL